MACHQFARIDRCRAFFCPRRTHLRLLECLRIPTTRSKAMKAVVDFSFAAALAAAIGIAVGGTAFSFVWLIHVLNA
jgi:hypothetical protein